MADLALGIDFVGSSAGLQDAVLASQRALAALNRDSSRMSFTLGRIMRTIVTPIAGVILSAFAAKKALADFTNSTLPGVNKYNQAMGLMRISMFRLSSAVGELLAPAAARMAGIITTIATKLEPMIRKISASMPSLAAFFRQLGSNLLSALRPLMPTVFGIIDSILSKFRGIDWGGILERLQDIWFKAWKAIANFMAPIITGMAMLIETFTIVAQQWLESLFNWVVDLLNSIATWLGVDLTKVFAGLNSVVAKIQAVLLGIIITLDVGLRNLPLVWQSLVGVAIAAYEIMRDNWWIMLSWMLKAMEVVAYNIATLLINAFKGAWPAIESVLVNIWIIGKSVFTQLIDFAIKQFKRLSLSISAAIIDGFADAVDYMPTWMAALSPGWLAAKNLVGQMRDLSAWFRSERDIQNPAGFNFKMPTLNNIAGVDFSRILEGLKNLPKFPDLATDTAKIEAIIAELTKTLGPDIAKKIADAIAKAPTLLNTLTANLPGIGGNVIPRRDQFSAIGPLLFGTSAAAARESNQTAKNPLVPLAQQQVALTGQALVVAKAAARAAARKARLARF